MPETFVTGAPQTMLAIDRMILQVQEATRSAVADGLALIQRQAQQNSSGRPGPNVRTGAHRAGIVVRAPQEQGAGTWVGYVIPTKIYSRPLEEGHPRWPSGVKYPYLGPAAMMIGPRLQPLFEHAWSSVIRRVV